jgi:hypothetical protein
MQYINTTTLAIFDTLGDVRKSILPASLPRIPTRDELNSVGIDYLYDYVPFESVLTYPVKGEPEYNEEYKRWQYSYTFAPKHSDDSGVTSFVESELKEAKDKTKTRLDKALRDKVDGLTNKAPFEEIVSFDKQEVEARAYLVDNSAVTPYLSTLAVSRNLNETIAELVQKVVTNADAYAIAHANILGEYQSLVKQVLATQADAINIDKVLKDLDALSFA